MTRTLLVLLALTFLTLVVFALWPGIDLAVSHYFYDEGRDTEKITPQAFGRVVAVEAVIVVEIMAHREIDSRPEREDDEREKG